MSAGRRVALLACGICLGPGCRKGGAGGTSAPMPIVTTASGVELVRLPGGWFEMGSAGGEPDETPVHRVWVDSLLMDRHEVTQDQFRRLQMPDPSHFKGPRRPVEHATFAEVVEFCNERSAAEGLAPCYRLDEQRSAWSCDFDANGYRLPTEAEWEYTCRASTTGERFFGPGGEAALRKHAWYADNSSKATHPVGLKKPNGWGLYDLYGNVAEWCNDGYDPNYYRTSPARNPPGP